MIGKIAAKKRVIYLVSSAQDKIRLRQRVVMMCETSEHPPTPSEHTQKRSAGRLLAT